MRRIFVAVSLAVVALAVAPALAATAGCESDGTVGNLAYAATAVGPFCAAATDPGATPGVDGGYSAGVIAADMSSGADPGLLTVTQGPKRRPSVVLHLRKAGENPQVASEDVEIGVATPLTTAPPLFVPQCAAVSPSGEVAVLADNGECKGQTIPTVDLAGVAAAIGAAAGGGGGGAAQGITLKGYLTKSRKDMLTWLTIPPPPGGTTASHVLIVLAAA